MRVLRGPPASEGGGSRSSGADVRGRAGRGGGSSGVEGWGGVGWGGSAGKGGRLGCGVVPRRLRVVFRGHDRLTRVICLLREWLLSSAGFSHT